MKSNLGTYSWVFLSGLVSLSIPLGLFFLSKLFSTQSQNFVATSQSKNIKPLFFGQRIHIQLCFGANAALALITLSLELVLCISVLQDQESETLWKGLFSILSIALLAMLGLLYCVQKKDIGWLNAFEKHLPLETNNQE